MQRVVARISVAPSSLVSAMNCSRLALLIAKPLLWLSSCRPTPRKFSGAAVEVEVAGDDLDRADAGSVNQRLDDARRRRAR